MKKLSLLELGKNLHKRNNNSSIISNIINKGNLTQTGTTDYSLSQEVSLNEIKTKEIKNKKKNKKKIKPKPLINIKTKDDENKKLNKKRSHPNFNTPKNILPKNVNAFYHLIYDNLFGSYESLNWALGLRLANNNLKNLNSKKIMTEPSFYQQDSKKYSEKISKDIKPLLNELNPNFNKIQHLSHGKTRGNINYSQFSFSSCLRNFKNNQSETNKEKEKKFNLTPLPKIKSDKFKIQNLSPITTSGINNLNNIENYIPKNYKIIYENTKIGNDNIKKKKLTINRNYTLSGFGDYLAEQKYNNIFRDLNISSNKELLNTHSNSTCKFELGLRDYKSKNNVK